MRDAIESASGDGKAVVARDDAGLTIDTAHWTLTSAPSAGRGRSKAPDTQQDMPGKSDRPGQVPLRRRFIPLACGVAAAVLLLLVPRTADRPEPRQPREPAPVALPSGEASDIAAMVRELAEARGAIAALKAQLQADASRNEQSLRQEQDKAAARAQDATAARQELAAAAALNRQALDGERAQRAALVDQLAASQRELQARTAQLRSASDDIEQLKQLATATSSQSLEQERQKAAALAQELSAVQREAVAQAAQLRKAGDEAGQLRQAEAAKATQALEQERQKAAALAQELSGAQREAAAQAAQLRKAGEDAGQLRQAEAARAAQALEQERQKAAAIAQAVAARQALTAAAAQHRQALDEERGQRTALTAELSAARRETEAQAAQLRQAEAAKAQEFERQKTALLAQVAAARQEQAAGIAQHRQLLDQERAQRSALAAELSAAQRELETRTAQLSRTRDEAGRLGQASEATITDLRQVLQQERDRAATMAQELVSLRAAAARPAAVSEPSKPLQAVAAVTAAQPVVVEARNNPEAARLIARASALLGQGDIGSARIVLERAAEIGSARASFMLAETYDPHVLSAWGTYGTRGEVTRARALYARAQAGGIAEAKERVEALRQAPDG